MRVVACATKASPVLFGTSGGMKHNGETWWRHQHKAYSSAAYGAIIAKGLHHLAIVGRVCKWEFESLFY